MLSVYDADGLILYPTNLEILNIEIYKTGGFNLTYQHKIIYEYTGRQLYAVTNKKLNFLMSL